MGFGKLNIVSTIIFSLLIYSCAKREIQIDTGYHYKRLNCLHENVEVNRFDYEFEDDSALVYMEQMRDIVMGDTSKRDLINCWSSAITGSTGTEIDSLVQLTEETTTIKFLGSISDRSWTVDLFLWDKMIGIPSILAFVSKNNFYNGFFYVERSSSTMDSGGFQMSEKSYYKSTQSGFVIIKNYESNSKSTAYSDSSFESYQVIYSFDNDSEDGPQISIQKLK